MGPPLPPSSGLIAFGCAKITTEERPPSDREVLLTQVNLRYAEDYRAGDVFDLGTYDVTRDEIIEFSRKYDPFPFHVDDRAAQATVFGDIIASGWLTGLVWLRLMHEIFFCHETTMGSPGHEEMNWPGQVRPGDRLQGRVEI